MHTLDLYPVPASNLSLMKIAQSWSGIHGKICYDAAVLASTSVRSLLAHSMPVSVPPQSAPPISRRSMMPAIPKPAMQAVEAQLKGLLLRGLEGDETAYRAFLDALSTRLRAYIRKRLFHLHDEVEDIVQETLLAVHNARHTYRADQPLTAWLYAIARYKLMDFLRVRSRHDAFNEPLEDHHELFASVDEEQSSAKRDVGVLLEQLPDKQRLPIQHVKLEGLSVAQTAQLTGLSESAVKIGIHRGLKSLATKIRLLT